MPQLLDRLHDAWQSIARSPRATQALAGWGSDPALRGFSDLEEVLAEILRAGGRNRATASCSPSSGGPRSTTSPPRRSSRPVMPGLKSLMSAYQLTGEPEEVATAVIEAAFERIRRCPCDRRPARVAANLLHDTCQILWRDGWRGAPPPPRHRAAHRAGPQRHRLGTAGPVID